ncbi:hypothetical protein Tco_0539299 [Tanacetum coccineum]
MLHLNRLSLPCRKAHLLEDKQIPSVGVFDEVSFYTLFQHLGSSWRIYMCLNSTWEEMGQDYNFTRSCLEDMRTVPGDGVAIPSDAIRMYKIDGVRRIVTASKRSCLKKP